MKSSPKVRRAVCLGRRWLWRWGLSRLCRGGLAVQKLFIKQKALIWNLNAQARSLPSQRDYIEDLK